MALHVDELIQKLNILGSKRQELQPLPKRMPIYKMAQIYTMLKILMKFNILYQKTNNRSSILPDTTFAKDIIIGRGTTNSPDMIVVPARRKTQDTD